MQQIGSGRRSTRLKGYDYSTPGAYYITACTRNRRLLFGRVENEEMVANRIGAIVEGCWKKLPDHFGNVVLDAFVLMPNHIHGVIIIEGGPTDVGVDFKSALAPGVTAKRRALPEIVRALKVFSTRRINEIRASPGTKVWQRGFYDHVIRNETELGRVRTYIMDNPRKWAEDADNPANLRR